MEPLRTPAVQGGHGAVLAGDPTSITVCSDSELPCQALFDANHLKAQQVRSDAGVNTD